MEKTIVHRLKKMKKNSSTANIAKMVINTCVEVFPITCMIINISANFIVIKIRVAKDFFLKYRSQIKLLFRLVQVTFNSVPQCSTLNDNEEFDQKV